MLVDVWDGHDDSRPGYVHTHTKDQSFKLVLGLVANCEGSPNEMKMSEGEHCKC